MNLPRVLGLVTLLVGFNVLGTVNGAGICDNMDLAEAERSFLQAFAVGFNKGAMSASSTQVLYCLKNTTEPLSLKQIPYCYTPRNCLLCRVASYALIASYRAAANVEKLTMTLVGLCQVADLPPDYCLQLAATFVNLAQEILKKNKVISPDDVCTMAFGSIGCVENPAKRTRPNPVAISKEDFGTGYHVSVTRPNVHPIKILHVTDVHYDPKYLAGQESSAEFLKCKKTLACCRNPINKTSQENYWGSYDSCDTPKSLLDNSLKQMAQSHSDVKLVYLTGDIVSHHIMEINLNNLKETTEYVFKQFMEAFKGKPILFALGNHDTDVFGTFPPNQGGKAAQVYAFYKEWTEKLWKNGHLTDKHNNIEWPSNGEGYYTVQLNEHLRVVVLNSNVAYYYNWWLLSEGHFYQQQLQWLERVLNQAEKDHQKVHILSHIAPNHLSLLPGWSEQYQAIVKRYRNTIVAQFNGHSHYDEFALTYDSGKPISVAWNGGSLTPHANKNPNYHVVTVDPHNSAVSALESYSMNLTEANKNRTKEPHWKLSFNMTHEYSLSNLSLQSLDGLVQSMAKNGTLVEKFWRHKVKNDVIAAQGLTPECKASVICSIVTSNFQDPGKCVWLNKAITWSYDKSKICPLSESGL